ncbi:MAG: class F sortase [Cellulomonas sp.]
MSRTTLRSAAGFLAAVALLSACSAQAATPADLTLSPLSSTAAGTPAPAAATAPTSEVTPVIVRSASLGAEDAPAVVPPVAVSIPSLRIEVPVDPVGVQADGQMQIPPLAERAGWYRYGSVPRDPEGTTVIAAHVDSVASAGLGPFVRLRDVAVGAQVTVTLADGTSAAFTVEQVNIVSKTDVPWDQVFVRDGAPRLVLITCGGAWQPAVRHYADNVIVVATPVP